MMTTEEKLIEMKRRGEAYELGYNDCKRDVIAWVAVIMLLVLVVVYIRWLI